MDEDNSVYSSLAGVLFNKSQTTLIQYPPGNGASYTVPDGVTGIGESAFHNCGSLTNITIPESVTSIGIKAFNLCSNLSSVTGGGGITSIESYAFSSCFSLTAITLGTNVTSIGSLAFYACQSLTAITIPFSVTSIGEYAFNECEQMTAITVDAANSIYSSLDGVLFNKDQTTLIRCPQAKAGIYVVPDTVTSIADDAFFYCVDLTRITVPALVTSIDNVAFRGCSSLKAMYFLGNAPSVAVNEFYLSDDVIIYYLPGTTGWGATLGLRDTVLWDPQVLSDDAGFGVQTDIFGFNITGNTGLVIVVVASTNLADAVWTPVGTNSLAAGGLSYFSDPQWTNFPWRYYRLRSP